MATERMGDGGPAFPSEYTVYEAGSVGNAVDIRGHSAGMTLRDYFAAKAMQGWLASFSPDALTVEAHGVASMAYEMADAMLAARGNR